RGVARSICCENLSSQAVAAEVTWRTCWKIRRYPPSHVGGYESENASRNEETFRWKSLGLLRCLGKDRLKGFPDGFCDDFMALLIRMNPIRQIQIRFAADAFQQKWNQLRPFFFRDASENFAEFRGVFLAHILRHLHSGDDDFYLRILF